MAPDRRTRETFFPSSGEPGLKGSSASAEARLELDVGELGLELALEAFLLLARLLVRVAERAQLIFFLREHVDVALAEAVLVLARAERLQVLAEAPLVVEDLGDLALARGDPALDRLD